MKVFVLYIFFSITFSFTCFLWLMMWYHVDFETSFGVF